MSGVSQSRDRRVSLPACPAVLLAAVVVGSIPAWAADDNEFVASGGEVLRQRLQIPWYDAQSDALRPIAISTRWELDLSWLAEPIYLAVTIVVVALLLVLIWLIVRVLRERQSQRVERTQADPLLVADRVEALPFLRERPQGDLLGQARHHYQQGNYSEAIIYLFSYQLIELDRSTLIRLAKGKTNRQYLREAGRVRPLKSLLERTMITFEDVFFGRRSLDRVGFEACWNQLAEFENLVSQAQATA
jgi:hypothetical protein